MEERFGKKELKDIDEETFKSYLSKIHTTDLYLTMGMSMGNEKAWEIFEYQFAHKIHDFAMYYADDEDIVEQFHYKPAITVEDGITILNND